MEECKMKIRVFLSRFFRKADLTDDDDIFSLGLVNSLFAMQLVLFLEKEFCIRVDNKDINLNNFRTINKMVALVQEKAGNAGKICI